MKKLLVVPHLGMGDYLICHGAIRAISQSKKYDEVFLIIKECYEYNIRYMFSDLSNVRYIVVNSNTAVEDHNQIINSFQGEKLVTWWYSCNSPEHTAEEHIYTSLGLAPECRYNNFIVQRNIDMEELVFKDMVGNSNKPYVFVADDPCRGYTIDISRVKGFENMRVIKSSDFLKYSMFDMLKVIEKAHSAHVMYSSFFILIDCMSLNKIYLHNSYLNKVHDIESYGTSMKRFIADRQITII